MLVTPAARSKISARKKVAAVIAAVLTVALLTGGVFAWTNFNQNYTNRFRGGPDPDVVLHDDFNGGPNKDVYVENAGDVPLIVRVKFTEYFQIGNSPIVGTDPNDKDTWVTHLFPDEALVGSDFPPAVSGEFDGNCELATHKYYSWVMSGKDKPYKPGTGDMGDYTYTNGQTFPDGTTAKSTMPNKSPITMAKYVSDKSSYDAEPDGRWILDMDGWAYWSKLLPSGEATNLLLDEVIQTVAPDDNYAYFINVILQASNATEYLDLIDQGATGNGEDLIEKLATGTENLEMDIERWLEISEGEYRPGNVLFLIPGNKYQLNAFEPGTQIPIKNVTWRLTGESVPGVTLDSTGVLAIDSGVPTATVLTGIVTLNTNPIKKMTFTITI